MKIKVEGLSETPLVISAIEAIADYESLTEMQHGGECLFLEPLQLSVSVAKEFDHIRVEGRVETKIRLACSRCLVEYDTNLISLFTVFYTKTSRMTLEEEVALSEVDLVSVSYDGDELDMTREVQEQVILEIPVKPLCKDDCRGLCPQCGADLNSGDCDCERTGKGFKFSALKNFTVKK